MIFFNKKQKQVRAMHHFMCYNDCNFNSIVLTEIVNKNEVNAGMVARQLNKLKCPCCKGDMYFTMGNYIEQ